MDSVAQLVLVLPVLLISVVAHEYAHARVALWQGDHTAAMLGRVTLNPLVHIDPVGTFLVPVVLWLLPGGFIFGWARPVPINSRNFRDYRRGDLLVSAAGVAANFALAVACTLLLVVLTHLGRAWSSGTGAIEPLFLMARFGLFFNLLLGVFNLIPVPPLDGSHLLYHLLPPHLGARYRELGRYSAVLLLAVLVFPGLLTAILLPVDLLMGLAEAVIGLLV
ncbi:MAG: site-2 protease family protein [Gemmatimonadota bacterium]